MQSRLPDPAQFLPEVGEIAGAMAKAVHNGTIPRATVALVQLRAGQIAGNTYHTVRQAELLRGAGEAEDRITAVSSWQDAPYFTDAERVAFELVEAVLTPNPLGERVSDELFARAAVHYDEKALWTLTVATGLAAVARKPRNQVVLPIAVAALVPVQVLLAKIAEHLDDTAGQYLFGLHGLNGLIILAASVVIIRDAWRTRPERSEVQGVSLSDQ